MPVSFSSFWERQRGCNGRAATVSDSNEFSTALWSKQPLACVVILLGDHSFRILCDSPSARRAQACLSPRPPYISSTIAYTAYHER